MTTDQLKELYQIVKEYIYTREGWIPETIEIDDDGMLDIRRSDYIDGSDEVTRSYLYVENIDSSKENLLKLAKEREEREEKERKKQEEYRKEQQRIAEENRKEQRYKNYLSLKKEFESK